MNTLSVIIPVYNAAQTLIPVVEACLHTVPTYAVDFDIIIVDDGSSDTTLSIAANLAAHYEPVMVVRHPQQRGYGAALLHGATVARGDYLLCLDSDNVVALHGIATLLPYTTQYNLVMGYRVQYAPRWYQHLRESLSNRLLTTTVHDSACHFALIQHTTLHQLSLATDGALILVEAWLKAQQQGYRAIQVPLPPHTLSSSHSISRYNRGGMFGVRQMVSLKRHMHHVVSHRARGKRAMLMASFVVGVRSLWWFLRRHQQ